MCLAGVRTELLGCVLPETGAIDAPVFCVVSRAVARFG